MDALTDPLFLSPALPSDLIHFIIHCCAYPTTLIICGDRAEFLSSLTQDVKQQQQQQKQQPQQPASHEPQPQPQEPPDTTVQQTSLDPNKTSHQPRTAPQSNPTNLPHPLLTASLQTVAVARHIRTVFVPTVSHLRAFLSVFSIHGTTRSKVSPPPRRTTTTTTTTTTTADSTDNNSTTQPLLLIYDFLSLHRNTSELSVQGLSSSAAAAVEAGKREGVRVVVVEQLQLGRGQDQDPGEGEGEPRKRVQEVLAERVPVLSSGSSVKGLDFLQGERNRWAGMTVDVGRVLGRWFRLREWDWGKS